MAKKNATPSMAQAEIIKRHGLQPHLYTVVKELPYSLIVKHRITGEFSGWRNKKPLPVVRTPVAA